MSAFLAVLLSIILLFQNTLCMLTGYLGAGGMVDKLLEQSGYSVLADFDGSVKKQYGLYMLYQDGETTKDKLSAYLTKNLENEAEFGLPDVHLEEMQVAAEGFSYLSHLEQQILEYCKYRIPLAGVEEFLERTEGLFGFLLSDATDFVLPDTDTTEAYDAEKEYDTQYYESFDMRQESQENLKGMLERKEEGVYISDQDFAALPSQNLVSGEALGWMAALERFANLDLEGENTIETAKMCMNDLGLTGLGEAMYEDYLINEYILSIFNSKTQTNRAESYLHWEVEYIILGNQGDDSNATYLKMLILLLRFVLNTIFIYQQEDMVTVADIAGYLATIWAYFEGQPIVKHSILAAWSFMESWHDYDLLLQGEKVPVYKTNATWHYWLSYAEDGAEDTISLYYKDYLRIFLLLVPREVKLARILDLIQVNESRNNSKFQILQSVTVFQVEVVCTYDEKRKWEIEAEGTYGYEAIG